MNRKYRLLLFDYWAKSDTYKEIIKRIDTDIISVNCFHVGSLRERDVKPLFSESGILYKDISHYDTNMILKVFAKERPDIIILLNDNYMLDRAVIMSAKFLNIQTIYLMHGILPTKHNRYYYQNAIKGNLTGLSKKRLLKYITFILPNYLISNWYYNPRYIFSLKTYLYLWEYIMSPHKSIIQSRFNGAENKADYAFVYGKIFADIKVEENGYSKNQISIVGNPFMDKTKMMVNSGKYQSSEYLNELKINIGVDRDSVIVSYYEGAFVEAGFKGWTEKSRNEYIEIFRKICSELGYFLVVKIHPKANSKVIMEYFKRKSNIILLEKYDITDLSIISKAIISEFSTALLIPVYLRKNIFIPRFGISRNIPNYFIKEKVAISCDSEEELKKSLSINHKVIKESNQEAFIEKYVSLSPKTAIDNINKNILKILKAQQ
jgi:hypothetical protein